MSIDIVYFIAVLLAETYIAPRLVDSNGTVVGMATQDDFINDIKDMVFDDDTGIQRGCFGGRAGMVYCERHETIFWTIFDC